MKPRCRLLLLAWILLSLAAGGRLQAEPEAFDAVQLLEQLIAIDTSNPPGNETRAAQFVRDYLARFGIQSEILESAPGRGNLVARLRGSGKKPALLLLGHLDVVPADPQEWKSPPFTPTRDGDYLYGRGAIDMKSLAALEIQAFVRLKREQTKLGGDVVLALVADEEAGGDKGAGFLVERHWDKVKADYVFTEGSIGLVRDGLHLYPIQVAEKGVAWMKLRATGTSGHGSMPTPDNAVIKVVRALNRVARWRQPLRRTPIAQEFLLRFSEHLSFPRSFLLRHLFSWPVAPLATRFFGAGLEREKMLNAMLRNTVVPTVLRAGGKTNVIPGAAEAEIDARILPGETPEGFAAQVRRRIQDPDVEVTLLNQSLPNASDFHTPYFAAIEAALRKHDPQAVVAPLLSPGATDNRFFRAKGALAYGIIPILITPLDLEGLHGKNERIPLAELQRGEAVLRDLIMSLAAE